MSIGSNDMTQLTLGLDRDSAIVAKLFDERDEAVKKLLQMAIVGCRKQGKYVGICGQGPSDHPGSGALAARAGHREHVAQSGHGGRDLAVPREREDRLAADTRGAINSVAVVAQLADRLLDIRERQVRALLHETLGDLGRPAPRQLLERAHIQVAIVEKPLERRASGGRETAGPGRCCCRTSASRRPPPAASGTRSCALRPAPA